MNYNLEHTKLCIIVSSVSYESPLQDLPEIESCLKVKNYIGNVVFDLLCSNGDELNRFVTMNFNGSFFNRRTLKALEKPSNDLISKQKDFYRQNKAFISNSILSSKLKARFN